MYIKVSDWNNEFFQAEKGLRVGTVNLFGDENLLLTLMYLISAAICWAITIGFIIKIIINRKKKRLRRAQA